MDSPEPVGRARNERAPTDLRSTAFELVRSPHATSQCSRGGEVPLSIVEKGEDISCIFFSEQYCTLETLGRALK